MPTSLTPHTAEHLGDPFRGSNESVEIGGALRRRPPRLSRDWRKAVVLVHVVGSVGWLGVTATFLVLTLALLGNRDAATLRSGYAVHELMVTWLARPAALLTLGTGLVLSFGTPWGLAASGSCPLSPARQPPDILAGIRSRLRRRPAINGRRAAGRGALEGVDRRRAARLS